MTENFAIKNKVYPALSSEKKMSTGKMHRKCYSAIVAVMKADRTVTHIQCDLMVALWHTAACH